MSNADNKTPKGRGGGDFNLLPSNFSSMILWLVVDVSFANMRTQKNAIVWLRLGSTDLYTPK